MDEYQSHNKSNVRESRTYFASVKILNNPWLFMVYATVRPSRLGATNAWLMFKKGVARQGGYTEFHIAMVVVVGADESVSNGYAVSLSFLPFSSIFS